MGCARPDGVPVEARPAQLVGDPDIERKAGTPVVVAARRRSGTPKSLSRVAKSGSYRRAPVMSITHGFEYSLSTAASSTILSNNTHARCLLDESAPTARPDRAATGEFGSRLSHV